ncbi:MAG: DUF58 domain-containing protein [Anaerolineae bacterium]|nr:DUF58 domain-containing protein [Anaerolineae bacterium]
MSLLRCSFAKARPGATVSVNTLWPALLTLVLVVVQVVYPSRVWIALLWAMGGLTAVAVVWAREMALQVRARRELRYGWVQVGDRLEERFTLENGSWLPVLWAEVHDASDLPGYAVDRVASCAAHSRVSWSTAQVCTRRGVYTLGPWSLSISDPFGVCTVSLQHDEREAILVHPPVVSLPEIALPRGQAGGVERAPRRRREETIDASHTRQYLPGDPLRHVHWPSTAHRGALMAREPEAAISGDLWIVLDLDRAVQAGTGLESTEEYGVILAASLADRTLREGRAVGLLAYGADLVYVPPGRGKAQLWRILRALAAAKAGGARPLAEVLRRLRPSLGYGTSVLLIAPVGVGADPVAWVDVLLPLTRSGRAPSAVLLDAPSFARAEGATAVTGPVEGARALLARAGVPVHVIRQGHPFPPLAPARRRGYWEFKVSPLGRAVVVRRPEEG